MPRLLKTLLILSLGFGTSCASNVPRWDGKIYIGSSKSEGIVRAQDKENISCKDDRINDYRCVSSADLNSFYSTYVVGCERWKEGTPMGGNPELKQLWLSIQDLLLSR